MALKPLHHHHHQPVCALHTLPWKPLGQKHPHHETFFFTFSLVLNLSRLCFHIVHLRDKIVTDFSNSPNASPPDDAATSLSERLHCATITLKWFGQCLPSVLHGSTRVLVRSAATSEILIGVSRRTAIWASYVLHCYGQRDADLASGGLWFPPEPRQTLGQRATTATQTCFPPDKTRLHIGQVQ